MWRVALAAVALALAGCAHKHRTAVPAVPVKIGHTETGIASWYGNPYHGRASASGEIYDMEAMVAAHKTMPFQTWVRVENLSNKKTVDVRIIDRGPFVKGRIIDLSHAAALSIDMVGPGISKVKLTVIKPPATIPEPVITTRRIPIDQPAAPAATAKPSPLGPPVAPARAQATAPSPVITTRRIPIDAPPAAPQSNAPTYVAPDDHAAVRTGSFTTPSTTYSVQVGVFRNRDNAERLRTRMAEAFGIARITENTGMFRVLVGAEPTEDAANTLADQVREKSGEKNAFVVRLDPQ
jgi:rare lipoprotein A